MMITLLQVPPQKQPRNVYREEETFVGDKVENLES